MRKVLLKLKLFLTITIGLGLVNLIFTANNGRWELNFVREAWRTADEAWGTMQQGGEFERRTRELVERWKRANNFCDRCGMYNASRLISPANHICRTRGQRIPILAVILVSTIHQHREHRKSIRETWGRHSLKNTAPIRVVFLLGSEKNGDEEEQSLLRREASVHRDILQDDFNSTYQVGGIIQLRMGLKWATEKCQHAKFIIKVSDDSYINVPRLLDLLKKMGRYLQWKLFGHCGRRWTKVIRNNSSQFAVSKEKYPFEMYPPYCGGSFMGFSQSLARDLIKIAPYIRYQAGCDDCFMGLCLEKLGYAVAPLKGVAQNYWPKEIRCPGNQMIQVHLHGKDAPRRFREAWKCGFGRGT